MNMLIALLCLAAVAIAALALLYIQQHIHANQQAFWMTERHELLNRIQRPEVIPVSRDMEPFEIPEQQPDGWARVGEIESIDDSYGLTDDDGS